MREDYARQGIPVDTAPPGQHVSVIERKILPVKNVVEQSYRFYHARYVVLSS